MALAAHYMLYWVLALAQLAYAGAICPVLSLSTTNTSVSPGQYFPLSINVENPNGVLDPLDKIKLTIRLPQGVYIRDGSLVYNVTYNTLPTMYSSVSVWRLPLDPAGVNGTVTLMVDLCYKATSFLFNVSMRHRPASGGPWDCIDKRRMQVNAYSILF